MNSKWQDIVNQHYQEVEKEYCKYEAAEIFVTMLCGSQNYGLATENSDVDTKTMLIPSLWSLVLGKKTFNGEYHVKDSGISAVKDFRDMFNNYCKGNINFLETLYTPYYKVNPLYESWFRELRENRDAISDSCLYSSIHCAKGMVHKEMANILVSKKPYKSLSEIYRLCTFIESGLISHSFAKALKTCKQGIAHDFAMSLRLNSMNMDDKTVKDTAYFYLEIIDRLVELNADKMPEENKNNDFARNILENFTYKFLTKKFGLNR